MNNNQMELVSVPMPKDIHVITLPSGKKIWCRNFEEGSRIYKEVYEEQIYKLPLKVVLDPKRIVDMGAHVGFSTIYFSENYPNAQIESYEPNPFNFQMLAFNTIQLGKRSAVYPCAVTTKEKQMYLFLGNGEKAGWTWGGSMIENHWQKDQNKIPFSVPKKLVTEICSTPIDILKIDIEGLEFEVFESLAKANLLRNIKVIMNEFHGTSSLEIDSLRKLEQLLIDNGFTVIIDSVDKELDLRTATTIDKKLFNIYAFQKELAN